MANGGKGVEAGLAVVARLTRPKAMAPRACLALSAFIVCTAMFGCNAGPGAKPDSSEASAMKFECGQTEFVAYDGAVGFAPYGQASRSRDHELALMTLSRVSASESEWVGNSMRLRRELLCALWGDGELVVSAVPEAGGPPLLIALISPNLVDRAVASAVAAVPEFGSSKGLSFDQDFFEVTVMVAGEWRVEPCATGLVPPRALPSLLERPTTGRALRPEQLHQLVEMEGMLPAQGRAVQEWRNLLECVFLRDVQW